MAGRIEQLVGWLVNWVSEWVTSLSMFGIGEELGVKEEKVMVGSWQSAVPVEQWRDRVLSGRTDGRTDAKGWGWMGLWRGIGVVFFSGDNVSVCASFPSFPPFCWSQVWGFPFPFFMVISVCCGRVCL